MVPYIILIARHNAEDGALFAQTSQTTDARARDHTIRTVRWWDEIRRVFAKRSSWINAMALSM